MFSYEQNNSHHSVFGTGVGGKMTNIARTLDSDNRYDRLQGVQHLLGASYYELWIRSLQHSVLSGLVRSTGKFILYAGCDEKPFSMDVGPHSNNYPFESREGPAAFAADFLKTHAQGRLKRCLTR